ncbi:MAG: PaaX family transcriptional regulator C-terminal domain-containing protein [Nocardioidaceae bacterium]
MNARSALFDVYGDHLRPRGGAAPVAALLRMLAPLEVAAPAVRTAISRMARQGWLVPVRLDQGAGYRLTPLAERRLSAAATRIYRRGIAPWDGRWHLLVLDHVSERSRRDRVRNGLGYLGYAALRDNTWISPRASSEVDALLAGEGVRAQRFWAAHDGDEASLAATAWDLDGIGRSYVGWLSDARELVGDPRDPLSDEEAFTVRSRLVHEWRKFLFRDPSLPAELLPAGWAGDVAAEFFDDQAERLGAGAGRFVDSCLRPSA